MRGTRFGKSLLLGLVLAGSLGVSASDAAVGSITEFPVTTALPQAVTTGPDGIVWFTATGNKVGRITPDGRITTFNMPEGGPSGPRSITAGPDGAVWFTGNGTNRIGRITITGQVTSFVVPRDAMPDASNEQLAAGSDGALWFTERGLNAIGRLTTSGSYTSYPLPHASSDPYSITAGPDGALWFTELSGNGIGRITTSGQATHYPLPGADSFPYAITTGPDGALWFTETGGIGRITTSGQISPVTPLPPSGGGGITTGADGNLWTTAAQGSVFRVTPQGVVTQFTPASSISEFGSITAAADGNVWYAETQDGSIARVAVAPKTIPTLTLNATAKTIKYRGSVTLKLHLSTHGANDQVSIYRTAAGGQTQVISGSVDGDGDYTATVTLSRNTTFTASYAGDAAFAPAESPNRNVHVRVHITGALIGGYATRSGYRLYHYNPTCAQSGRNCVPYTATVLPNRAGACVYVHGQMYRNGAWRNSFTTRCTKLGPRSRARITAGYDSRAIIGRRLRIRAEFRSDAINAAANSAWSRFKIMT